jgi:hypothetical protein
VFEGGYHFAVGAIFHWFGQYGVAVVVLEDKLVLVASIRLNWEAAR